MPRYQRRVIISLINQPFIFLVKKLSCFSSYEEETNHAMDEGFSNKHSTELDLPTHLLASRSPAKQKMTFGGIKSLAVQFGTHCVGGFDAPAEHLATSCSASPPSVQCTTLQERMDLEMSVLRRQEAVLKLQEEYYTLKIKMMKKQMEEPLTKDWKTHCTCLRPLSNVIFFFNRNSEFSSLYVEPCIFFV